MKAKLSTLTVPDPTQPDNKRRVKTWFGMPSDEREAIYPFIAIDLIDIVFATDRAHSMQVVDADWWPSVAATFQEYADLMDPPLVLEEDHPYGTTILFQPYDLYYQVASHCRTALQDRHLTMQLLSTSYMPLNNIGTLHVPADETQRWLDNMGSTRADYRDQEGKVVWRKVYNVKVSAHMAVTDPVAYAQVLALSLALKDVDSGESYASWQLADA